MMNQRDSSSKANTNQTPNHDTNLPQGFSATLKQILDGMPKLACAIVAVWDYFHTRDIERFVLLLAIGHTASYSLPKLKALAPKVGTLAKAIAALLDKVK